MEGELIQFVTAKLIISIAFPLPLYSSFTAIKSINSDFLSAELCLKLQYYKYNFKEIPVKYFQRKEDSKALPISSIPKQIASFLMNYFKLKKQLKSIN